MRREGVVEAWFRGASHRQQQHIHTHGIVIHHHHHHHHHQVTALYLLLLCSPKISLVPRATPMYVMWRMRTAYSMNHSHTHTAASGRRGVRVSHTAARRIASGVMMENRRRVSSSSTVWEHHTIVCHTSHRPHTYPYCQQDRYSPDTRYFQPPHSPLPARSPMHTPLLLLSLTTTGASLAIQARP